MPVHFISVVDEPQALDEMLRRSHGERKVPVIVEGDRVTVGFQGKG